MSYVYQTIYHNRKLFLEAPTGVGKTIATVFPALKAMGRGMGEKLFYLTAKTITASVAEDTLTLLRERGLRFKSVVLTAKDKICFLEKAELQMDMGEELKLVSEYYPESAHAYIPQAQDNNKYVKVCEETFLPTLGNIWITKKNYFIINNFLCH